ncbi:hypothetical protein [Aestuariibaculum suncheonense]|uniref:Uncharacterized protein n=1 Tax=Aestuariibaculum suncheonense TaxID=1028745 RepID=A0A8J6QGS5_9FLAO|nr:hypothetical protein [Aestuariibaculum suncheonense]MBD0835221.1 hypothetical protein [Aestuariibaculum suncheonense]
MNGIFTTIRDNLTRSYLFYIPDTIYNEFQQTEFKDLVPAEATNTIAFRNRKEEITTNETKFNRVEIATKCNLFEENVFLLIDAQEKLTESQFQFLMNKYWEHLDIHTNITYLMYVNLSKYFKDVSDNVTTLFKLQQDAFLKHHTEIKTKFSSFISGSPFKEKTGGFNVNEIGSEPIKKTTLKAKKTKKPQLISDADADAFLLESVFNINHK